MIVTTTPTVEGRPVGDYLGIVTGEAVVHGTLNDLGTALQNIGSGRGHLTEKRLFEASQLAVNKMSERAQELGAGAIVGIQLDFQQTGAGVVVIAVGTAVKLAE